MLNIGMVWPLAVRANTRLVMSWMIYLLAGYHKGSNKATWRGRRMLVFGVRLHQFL